jgi:hypothetical protein
MRLAADLSEMVVVNVKILEQNTESFEIETREIEQRNLPENMNAVFKESGLDVRIRADREMLEKLKEDEIRAYVDFKEVRAPGDVTLPVQIVLPAGYTLAAEVTADSKYIVFLFRTSNFTGKLKSSAEGRMEWMTLDDMRRGGLAPNMEEYIRVLLEDDAPQAYGISGKGGLNVIK